MTKRFLVFLLVFSLSVLVCRAQTTIPVSSTVNSLVSITPWVTRVSATSATIGIEFFQAVASGIRLSASGDAGPRTQWTTSNGLMRLQSIHRFDLADLEPGTTYDYAIVVLDESIPTEVEVASGRFTTAPAGSTDHVFFAVSDNQVSPQTRIANFDAMFKNCGMGTADFIASLGDLDSTFDDFRSMYFKTFYDVLVANGYGRQAQIVRGNHEYRGKETDLYFECFGTGYYAFSFGDVFYIVLDNFEDQIRHDSTPAHYTLRNSLESYIEAEARWFEGVIHSEACRNASKRIVLAHTVPFEFENNFYFQNLSRVVGKYLFGSNPECPIDLWLCGDIHSPYRFDPVAKTFYGAKRKAHPYKIKRYKAFDRSEIAFPVFVNDGPDGAGVDITVTKCAVSQDGIRLTQMTPDGTVMDDVTFRKGQPAEIHSTTFVNYDENFHPLP